MLIERCAYGNRWRAVSPAAKGLFALAGFVAAFAASRPLAAATVAGGMTLVTLVGAGIPPGRFARAALPPLGFLLLGGLTLAGSLDFQGKFVIHWLPGGWAPILQLAARSCGALTALLFLALTTPMSDLIALLRRLKTPETLLEIMTLCYRMLFVFLESLGTMRTAQAARLGYATPRLALRSLSGLIASLAVQIWQRSHALHLAAESRNGGGALRFLAPEYAHARRDLMLAALGGALLIGLSAGIR